MSSGMGTLAQWMQILTGSHSVTKHTYLPLAACFPLPPAAGLVHVLVGGREVMPDIFPAPRTATCGNPWGRWASEGSVQPPCWNVLGTWISSRWEEAVFHPPVTSAHPMVLPVWVVSGSKGDLLSGPRPLLGLGGSAVITGWGHGGEGSQSARAAENPSYQGREVCWLASWGSMLAGHALWCHRTSLTKLKDKIIENFKVEY